MKTAITLIAACVLAHGGQSLSNTSTAVYNYGVPQLNKSGSVRAEMYFHDWPSNPAAQSGFPCLTHAAGFYCQFTSNNYLNVQSYWSQENRVFQIPLAGFPTLGIYIRWMHDPTGGTETVEAWDTNGVRRFYSTQTVTLNSDTDGGVLVGGASTAVGFFRVHTTLVAVNSRPPVTSDNSNTYIHWKFDSSMTDSALGSLYPASGSPSYMTTPYQIVIAKAKTYNAPAWADWVSLRAGQWNQFDGSSSYSQSDSTAAVSYTWTQTAGAYAAQWDAVYNQSHATPKVRGLVFGSYTFRLTVSDGVNSGYTDLTVGAVATDEKGIVIQGDPNADKIFGPMIAFGKNPWGYMDERHFKSIGLQTSYLSGWLDPVWTHYGAGTVSYPFSGKGMWYGGGAASTLTSTVGTAETATFPVADASVYSLSSLPTWIAVGNLSSGIEFVRICSTTATTGSATLTPCYNGRAQTMSPDGQLQGTTVYTTPHSWPSGTTVGELRIQGTGTQFVSDSTVPICPAGSPGPAGPVTYSTGTVTLTGGSSTIVGSGTTWSGHVYQNNYIRIAATHASGSAFVFWATITAVTDSTHLAVDRPIPADIDAGAWSYKIIQHRIVALHFTDPYGADQALRYGTLGCESETAAFAVPYYDIAALNGTTQAGKHYTYKPYTGDISPFGPNFYGTGLAARGFYYRSGYSPALDLANTIDNKWTKSPEVAAGYAGGLPLNLGGGAIGAMANVLLNPSAQIGWADIRHWFEAGNIGSWGCNDDDTRDTGYYGYWTVFGSMFDPNPTFKSEWQTNLNQIYTRENTCKSQNRTGLAVEVNSWAESGYRWAGNYGNNVVSLTNGQSSGTGSGIDSSTCYGIAQGSGATLTNNSATMTGTGFVTGSKIWLHGTKSGQSIYRVMRFTRNSSTSITLIGLWDGDTSSSISWMIDNSDWILTFGQNANSASLIKNYACIWNSSSSITLDRPWESATGTYYKYGYVLSGHGTQPYMLGIKTTEFNLARQSSDSTTATNFATLANLAAGWIRSYGYDATTGGLYYGRVFGACEPPVAPATVSQMGVYVTPGCNSDGGISGARVLIGEVSSSLYAYYLANSGLGDSISWGDQVYGALWGYTPWNSGGVYSDQYSIGNVGGFNTTDTDLGSYKWSGFFFGMGMAHQWPAVRLGGVSQLTTVSASALHHLGTVPGASVAKAVVIAPSGGTTQFTCGATCVLTLDSRQGDHWLVIQYLNESGVLISQDPLTFLPLDGLGTPGIGRAVTGRVGVGGNAR